jgi:predicted NBD/HSP70 family sugar kinase
MQRTGLPMTPTTRDIYRGNRLAILRYLYAGKAASRPELSRASGLSPATVANLVTDLIDAGIVAETGIRVSVGGRPRAELAVNAERGVLVGVDVAETYVHFELFDLGLHQVHAVERALHPEENQPVHLIEHLQLGLERLLAETGTSPERVLGVGISVPGLVDRAEGVSIFAPNWGWRGVPLMRLIGERIPFPIRLDNPLKAFATAELWFGAGWEADNVVTLVIGTGVGAGLIVSGTVYRGETNSAGEWGHTVVVADGRSCRCGGHGCLEAYIGAPGIAQHLRELAPGSTLLNPEDQTATVKAIAAAAAAGDPEAMLVVKTTARYVGIGVANLVNLFNPRIVVLGGWVGLTLGPVLLPEVERAVAARALEQPARATSLRLCRLHHNPVSMGMAAVALETWLAGIETGTAADGLAPAIASRRSLSA